MRWYLANETCTIDFDLIKDDMPFTPDDGTTTYTIRDIFGVPIAGYVNQPLDVPGTLVSIEVPAAVNTVASGNETEQRYLTVAFKRNGRSDYISIPYGLHPFLLMQSTGDDVRAVLGVTADELPDSDIDLVGSYYTLKTAYTTDFMAALSAGDLSRASANRAVTLTAAINVIPSLQLRVWQSRKSENSTFSRLATLDFAALNSSLSGLLLDAINGISTAIANTGTTVRTIFDLSLPTDPVTNT